MSSHYPVPLSAAFPTIQVSREAYRPLSFTPLSIFLSLSQKHTRARAHTHTHTHTHTYTRTNVSFLTRSASHTLTNGISRSQETTPPPQTIPCVAMGSNVTPKSS